MSSRRSFSHLAATHPVVPLLVGYGLTSVLLALVVALQSGPGTGLGALFANLVLLSPALGITWIAGRLIARRAPKGQEWWMTRAHGHLAGFIGAVAIAAVPLVAVVDQVSRDPAATSYSRPALVAVLVGIVAFVNAVPLFVAFGVEAWARRRVSETPAAP